MSATTNEHGPYNLLIASVVEAVDKTVNHKYKYTQDELETLSKPQLVEIILKRQEAYDKKKRTKKRKASNPTSPTSKEYIGSPRGKNDIYEKNQSHMKATERHGTDYAKIEKQREKIRKLKEKKKKEKEEDENQLRSRNANRKVQHNPHEKLGKKMKPSERMATDYDKIAKKRAEIRALKEKNKKIKMNNENSLKYRNEHRTNNLFTESHEKVVKVKPLKEKKAKKKKNKTNKDKIADPVSKEIMETRDKMQQEHSHDSDTVTSSDEDDSESYDEDSDEASYDEEEQEIEESDEED